MKSPDEMAAVANTNQNMEKSRSSFSLKLGQSPSQQLNEQFDLQLKLKLNN